MLVVQDLIGILGVGELFVFFLADQSLLVVGKFVVGLPGGVDLVLGLLVVFDGRRDGVDLILDLVGLVLVVQNLIGGLGVGEFLVFLVADQTLLVWGQGIVAISGRVDLVLGLLVVFDGRRDGVDLILDLVGLVFVVQNLVGGFGVGELLVLLVADQFLLGVGQIVIGFSSGINLILGFLIIFDGARDGVDFVFDPVGGLVVFLQNLVGILGVGKLFVFFLADQSLLVVGKFVVGLPGGVDLVLGLLVVFDGRRDGVDLILDLVGLVLVVQNLIGGLGVGEFLVFFLIDLAFLIFV